MRTYATARLFNEVGHGGFFNEGSFGHYAAHALAGCASQAIGGGNCGRAALSAVGGLGGTWASSGNAVTAVVAGGTVSVLGGGKFENGAMTAAFGYLFNCMQHPLGCSGKVKTEFGRVITGGTEYLPKWNLLPEGYKSQFQDYIFDGPIDKVYPVERAIGEVLSLSNSLGLMSEAYHFFTTVETGYTVNKTHRIEDGAGAAVGKFMEFLMNNAGGVVNKVNASRIGNLYGKFLDSMMTKS